MKTQYYMIYLDKSGVIEEILLTAASFMGNRAQAKRIAQEKGIKDYEFSYSSLKGDHHGNYICTRLHGSLCCSR